MNGWCIGFDRPPHWVEHLVAWKHAHLCETCWIRAERQTIGDRGGR